MMDPFPALPNELKQRPQWCCWRYEMRDGRRTKPPVDPNTGKSGDSTDPSKWSSYQHAVRKIGWKSDRGVNEGIGFVFVAGGPYCGVDLDKCRDAHTGAIEPWAQEIVDRFAQVGAYIEVSPSKTGVKIFTRGKIPGVERRRGNIEMYSEKRYFTTTGIVVGASPAVIGEGQKALDWLYFKTFGEPYAAKKAATDQTAPVDLTDDMLIQRARSAKNGTHFEALWQGDTSSYNGDDSAADLAVCNLLAFWTGSDPARIDRLFRRSGLMRDKWLRDDYRERTIAKAIESATSGYSPSLTGTSAISVGHVPAGVVKVPNVKVAPWIPFPVELLPAVSRRFISRSAAALGCDPAMIAVPHLISAAAAIGNSRVIRLKNSWREPSIAWGINVATSGTLKSPATDLTMKSMAKVESDAYRKWNRRHKEWEEAIQLWEDSKKSERGMPPEEPVCDRYMVNDSTVEALAMLLSESPRGLLLVRDELSGFIRSFDAYRKVGQGSDRAHYLEMFHGRRSAIDRKTGNHKLIVIPRAALSIYGTIQPGILRRLLTPEFFHSGFTARCLLFAPPAPLKTWREDEDIDDELMGEVDCLFSRLLQLQLEVLPNGDQIPVDVHMEPAAKERWAAFYNRHNEEAVGLEEDERSAWAKLEAYAARFALVVHNLREYSGESRSTLIEAADLESSVGLTAWFGNETRRVYALLQQTPEQDLRNRLIECMRRKAGSMTVRELRRALRRFREDQAGAESALRDLVAAGLAHADPTLPTRYLLNPEVLPDPPSMPPAPSEGDL